MHSATLPPGHGAQGRIRTSGPTLSFTWVNHSIFINLLQYRCSAIYILLQYRCNAIYIKKVSYICLRAINSKANTFHRCAHRLHQQFYNRLITLLINFLPSMFVPQSADSHCFSLSQSPSRCFTYL